MVSCFAIVALGDSMGTWNGTCGTRSRFVVLPCASVSAAAALFSPCGHQTMCFKNQPVPTIGILSCISNKGMN